MIQDALLVFSDAQAETTVAAHDSDNILDLQGADPNFGIGTPKYVNIVVNTTCTSGGSATVKVGLYDSSDNSTWTVLAESEAYAVANLTAGKVLMSMSLPAEHERYLKVVYTIATAALTAGKFDAWIGLDQPRTP